MFTTVFHYFTSVYKCFCYCFALFCKCLQLFFSLFCIVFFFIFCICFASVNNCFLLFTKCLQLFVHWFASVYNCLYTVLQGLGFVCLFLFGHYKWVPLRQISAWRIVNHTSVWNCISTILHMFTTVFSLFCKC